MKNSTMLRFCTKLVCLLVFASSASADDKSPPDFARDIQPIFKSRCYSCHDTRKKTAAFRLDVRSSALRGGESGKKAIVPGHAREGELIRRVTANNEEDVMPPSGPRLTADQINLLKRWIDAIDAGSKADLAALDALPAAPAA